ncbi:hypothetical protein HBH42_248530 [Parastagonospora nodorum]|nr:hypothetical protein HBH42_248530 [Parastagonospora nodorum]
MLLLKLLKEIFLIAIRIYYCIILCYLVCKHSYLLTYYSLIYIRIISRDRLLGFNSIKGNITVLNIATALSTLIKLAANKLLYLASIALLKLLKKILLIAIRICYCIILYYLVYKYSCLLTYYFLIYIRIIPRDRLLSFNSIKGNIMQSSKIFNNSYNNSNSNSNAKI